MSTSEVKKTIPPKTGCFFADEAVMLLGPGNESEELHKHAKLAGCNDQCTLENGCILYKRLRELSKNDKMQHAAALLRKEFTDFMLGGED